MNSILGFKALVIKVGGGRHIRPLTRYIYRRFQPVVKRFFFFATARPTVAPRHYKKKADIYKDKIGLKSALSENSNFAPQYRV